VPSIVNTLCIDHTCVGNFFVHLKCSVPCLKFVPQQGIFIVGQARSLFKVLDTFPVIIKLTTYLIHRLNNCTFVQYNNPRGFHDFMIS